MIRIEIACSAVFLAYAMFHPTAAFGQGVFDGGNTAFDPQIHIVNSGAILDAQAVVSHDEKYVTINARASNTSLLALRTFSFAQAAPLGYVGSAALQAFIAQKASRPALPALPVPSVLDRVGISKLD